MLLETIDENHKGIYDFIYLPIDFKVFFYNLIVCLYIPLVNMNNSCWFQNKCNVGYAFINLTQPQHIVPFHKVCALISHLKKKNFSKEERFLIF